MLVAHVLYRLDFGGLETVVAELINRLPQDQFQHAVICLTQHTEFRNRIIHPHVTFHALDKRAGKDWRVWVRLWRLLRRLNPDIVHTCNIAAMEAALPAWLAGVPVTIHAEHGRDSYDLDGSNRKYLFLRRALSPLVDRFVPVSRDLDAWLQTRVGIPAAKIRRIINGIDLHTHPARPHQRQPLPKPGFAPTDGFVVGTVGRLWPVKDHGNLIRAFALLVQKTAHPGLRLVIVGDGPQAKTLHTLATTLGVADRLWITGWHDDVPNLLRGMDLFVLSSLAEGTPLTILEAMATGLPVVSSRVGGVADLVANGHTGQLCPPADAEALAEAMAGYVKNPEKTRIHGTAGRKTAEERFAVERMVAEYQTLFEQALAGGGNTRRPPP